MRRSSISFTKKLGLSLFVVGGLFIASQAYRPLHSSDLTQVSVTLSNPRLSFVGRLAAGNISGTTNVVIKTTGTISSLNTNQLQEGDTVRIGQGGAMGSYVVKDNMTGLASTFTTTAANSNVTTDDFVIASQSGTLTVRFITASAQNNGKIRVLVPAVATTGADGIPDTNTFDYGAVGPTVTCPTNITNYTFSAGAAASMQNIGGTYYHAFTCAYTGTGTAGANFTNTAQLFTIASLINPSPQIAPTLHATGTADTYKIIVQQLDSSNVVQDYTAVSVGMVEAVKVSAEVAPQITFAISGIAQTQTPCGAGLTTNVTTTAAEVPFGELTISTFKYAAQKLAVSTNAQNGYIVTVAENDQLSKFGASCTGDPVIGTNQTCIQDSRGDGATMSHTLEDDWNLIANTGFAYTMASQTGSPTLPFVYSQNTGGCTATGGTNDCFKQFADTENSQTPEPIMTYNTVTNTQEANICYGINVGATQVSGSYENYLTFRATGSF
ncbi:hypothetical protein KA012_04380 [Candidatus Woesebacteria bacterium]|nr:hypothetical protein [Candidatus Woesebacteria bacterium]